MSDVAYITNAAATLTFTAGSKTVTVTGTNPILEGVLRGDRAPDPNGMELAIDAVAAGTLTLLRNAPTSGTVQFDIAPVSRLRTSLAANAEVTRDVYAKILAAAEDNRSIPVVSQATAPPGSPADGDRHLVIATATGVFAGKEGYIAQYDAANTRWIFISPIAGMKVTVDGSAVLRIYTGAAWTVTGATDASDIAFTPTGGVAATTVQAAIAEVDSEKVTRAGDTMTAALAVNASGQALPAAPTGPNTVLHGASAGSTAHVMDSQGGSAVFTGRRANGTLASPTALLNNDVIAVVQGFGYGSTAYSAAARAFFRYRAAENWSDTAQGTYFELLLTPTTTAAATVRLAVQANGDTTPGADNAQKLGAASLRWSEVFAGTGTINTSDAREKRWLGGLADAEMRVARRLSGLIGIYQWNDAVERKGDAARRHVGVTAQAVAAAFVAEGLDPAAYAIWCEDEVVHRVTKTRRVMVAVVDEDGAQLFDELGNPLMHEVDDEYDELEPNGETRQGIRYDQLYAFVTAAALAEVRLLSERLDAVESRA
jgi:hypothetical protein